VAGAFSLRTHGWLALHPHSLAASGTPGTTVVFLPSLQRNGVKKCRVGALFSLGETKTPALRTFFRDSQMLVSKKKSSRLLFQTT
jgi:hypothetical protein